MAATERRAEAGYETRDVRVRHIAYASAGFLAVIALALAALWLAQGYWLPVDAERTQSQANPARTAPPRLQAEPGRDLAELRAREERLLSEYRWLDREAGILRIPIERAMTRLVETQGEDWEQRP